MDSSTQGTDKGAQMRLKKKSTNSLPESLATKKVYESKDAKRELYEMFKVLPTLNKNGYQTCSQKWNDLGAIQFKRWLEDGKIKIQKNWRMMVLKNDYGFDKYYGQINESGKYHGIGRLCRVTGQIYEGNFFDGEQHGYGREIDYHHNYEGMYNQGKKVDEASMEWSSGKNDSYFD